jgi:hypothetical protein
MSSNKFVSVLKFEWALKSHAAGRAETDFDKSQLEEDALTRIFPMVSEGLRAGEFSSVLNHPEGGPSKTFSGTWSFQSADSKGAANMPFGVLVSVSEDGVSAGIASNLAQCFSDEDGYVDEKGEAAAEALESFLLALAGNGVNLSQDAFTSALETAVDSIGQNMW